MRFNGKTVVSINGLAKVQLPLLCVGGPDGRFALDRGADLCTRAGWVSSIGSSSAAMRKRRRAVVCRQLYIRSFALLPALFPPMTPAKSIVLSSCAGAWSVSASYSDRDESERTDRCTVMRERKGMDGSSSARMAWRGDTGIELDLQQDVGRREPEHESVTSASSDRRRPCTARAPSRAGPSASAASRRS